ncbi:hypothetical protein SISNIDRAFT_320386 [Sistotremastrum niveocremeum HHB9708]|uniref:Uncharacterized protein n=1 Tax=Sistotremastrum niveocremeum HHB9708 TaxID=1314777 RepID=A0A164MZ72_9AGAM|nr:hypothetical protein SISNIDRAFT_320386 [Sistotremastrum niveocremeum HHB9708]
MLFHASRSERVTIRRLNIMDPVGANSNHLALSCMRRRVGWICGEDTWDNKDIRGCEWTEMNWSDY